VWDAQSGQLLTETLKHSGPVWSAQFSPDGRRIVTALDDRTARVWDAQSGLPLTEPLRHNDSVRSGQFSPDGRRIVTASEDGTARVWEAATGRPLTEPLKHGGPMWSAQFSPDGGRIATASADKTAREWDAWTGRPLTEPLKHGAPVRSAEFSADGRQIVTGSEDGCVKVWDVAPASGACPDWLLQLSEAISGQVLNKQGILEESKLNRAETIKQIREKLNDESGDNDWVVLGRWFLADPSTRTISPFSKITVPQYIENRIKENTAESLAEAEQLAYGNTELLERISKARKALGDAK
jgi:WD40 repeat protein